MLAGDGRCWCSASIMTLSLGLRDIMFKLIGLVALGAVSASGATFTAFNVHTNSATLPSTPLTFTYGESTANVGSATISCPYSGGCSNTAFVFSFSATGYDPTQILSATLGGTLSGTTPASGTFNLSGNFDYSQVAFPIPVGTFDASLGSTSIPFTGTLYDLSFFSLTLAPYQVLTLTEGLTFSFTSPAVVPSSVPEPRSVLLLAAGLAGFILLGRRGTLRDRSYAVVREW